MSDLFGVATALAAVLALGVIALGRLRAAVLLTVLITLAVAALVWLAGLGLMATGWQDTDGWVDCNRNCHGRHWLGGLLIFTPPLLAIALVFAVSVAVIRGRFGDARHAR